jgi:hypothetical protein
MALTSHAYNEEGFEVLLKVVGERKTARFVLQRGDDKQAEFRRELIDRLRRDGEILQ